MAKKEKAQAEEVMNQEVTVEVTNAETVEATEATETAEETKEEAEVNEEQPAEKDKKDILIEELNDKYMRTFAEFDNFRKRSEKEKAAMFEVGISYIAQQMV